MKTFSVLFFLSQIFFIILFSYLHDKPGMFLAGFGLFFAAFQVAITFTVFKK